MIIDKLKEQIGWLKVTYGLSLATDISLVAWIFNNFNNVNIISSSSSYIYYFYSILIK